VRAETSQVQAIADAAGLGPSEVARAEAELAAGGESDARDRLERNIASAAASGGQLELSRAVECLARACSDLGDWDATLAATERGLELTLGSGQLPLTWRLRGCRAHALDRLGRAEEATAARAQAQDDFDTLTGRIPDPALQAWFIRQPLAARWLERTAEPTNEEAGT